jgi:hypothetical protein
MTRLNFYPFYKKLLEERKKYVTIRLGDQRSKYYVGQEVDLTVGWNEEASKLVDSARITDVDFKKIEEIVEPDIDGESPDCASKKQIPYILSSIYRKVVTEHDHVTIIRWKYLE